MFKLILALILIQSVISDDFQVTKDIVLSSSSQPIVLTFNRPDWNNIQEFAISGWIRIDKWVNNEQTIFRFIQNANSTNSKNQVDNQVLKAVTQDNSITFQTYDSRNSDPRVEHQRLVFPTSDFGQWIFIYQGYNMADKKTYGQIITPSVNLGNSCNSFVDHVFSDYYQLIFGENAQYSNNVIEIAGINISYGNGAYKQSGFDQDAASKDKILPVIPQQRDCITTFNQCNYTGDSQIYCNQKQAIGEINFKSAYVPDNTSLSYTKNNSNNQTYIIKNNIACLSSNNIDDIVNLGQAVLQNINRLLRVI